MDKNMDEKEFEETWELNKDGLARHPGDKFVEKWYFMESRRLMREKEEFEVDKWEKMEGDEKEFEECWKIEEWQYGEKSVFFPIIKRVAKYWWLASRRLLNIRVKELEKEKDDLAGICAASIRKKGELKEGIEEILNFSSSYSAYVRLADIRDKLKKLIEIGGKDG